MTGWPLLRGKSAIEVFLLDLVRVGSDGQALLVRSRGLPVGPLIAEATDHGVVSLLDEAARTHPSAWPELTDACAAQWSQHVAWTMRLLVDLREAVDALGRADIPYAVVKGPVLGGHLYGDPVRRASSDLDLLVHRRDRERAAAALRLAPSPSFADADLDDSGQVSAVLSHGTPLDLHWELVNDPAARRDTDLDATVSLGRTCVVDVAGHPVATLDAEDTVLHLVSHALVSGGHRLIWYADLDRALRDPALDPEVLARRAKESRLGTGLTLMARRCAEHLGTPRQLLPKVDTSPTWTLLSRPVEALSPPSGSSTRPSRGQLVYRATRQDARSSLRALAGVAQEARGILPRPVRSVGLISLEPWDTTWRRNQHLVSELVRQRLLDRVVFVEPAIPGRGARRHSPLPGVEVIRPSLMVPKRLGGLAAVGAWLRTTALRNVDLVWVNDPDLGRHCLPVGRPAIYDVTDDWRTFAQAPRVLRRLIAGEDLLARRARTVVCSQVLADRWRERYGVDASVLHNGIDVKAFSDAQPFELPGSAPHIGYVGTLHAERLDVDLLIELASTSDVGTVHLVGPSSLSDLDTDRLTQNGVALHGPVPSAAVAAWMASMDVLVSPHLVSAFTLSLDAIKSYEYLATGLPVVATPSSGFQLLTAPQLTVTEREGFCAAVVSSTKAPRAEPLLDSGWDRRAQVMARLLGT